MRGVNKVFLLGHLGKSPEIRFTPGGTIIANFSLATTERAKDGGDWVDKTEWHNLVAFNRTAEVARDYLGKGSPLYVEGRLQTRSWEKDGVKHYRTEIVISEMVMLGTSNEERPAASPVREESSQMPLAELNQHGMDISDQDIPF